jgi:RHS repeat-associated protein
MSFMGIAMVRTKTKLHSVNVINAGTTTYAANELNQYTNVGGALPTYDDNGNLTFDGTWTYTYDRENRLVQAANDQMTISYTYDAFNRLIERAVGASVTRFYYDDRWRLIAEYDGNDALVGKYVYGPEVDEPVRLTDVGNGNTTYYYHAAALGTVTEITDATGNLVERYRYDVYGEPTIFDPQSSILVGSGIGNRLLFQGRDRDPDTGLYNFRNRYYSPGWGRFVQVDPVRVEIWPNRGPLGVGSGLDLYGFVSNRPTSVHDPLGLVGVAPQDVAACLNDAKNDYKKCVKCVKDRYADRLERIDAGYGGCVIECQDWPFPLRGLCYAGCRALLAVWLTAITVELVAGRGWCASVYSSQIRNCLLIFA